MKNVNILIIVLILLNMSLQKGCAQTPHCPANNKKAEKILKNYLTKEKNIKSLREQYEMAISESAIENVKPLTSANNVEKCQKLRSHLEWLENQEHYSIYIVADHYFIVLYSFTKDGNFQMDEIPIINSKYEALGSIINFNAS